MLLIARGLILAALIAVSIIRGNVFGGLVCVLVAADIVLSLIEKHVMRKISGGDPVRIIFSMLIDKVMVSSIFILFACYDCFKMSLLIAMVVVASQFVFSGSPEWLYERKGYRSFKNIYIMYKLVIIVFCGFPGMNAFGRGKSAGGYLLYAMLFILLVSGIISGTESIITSIKAFRKEGK